MFLRTLLYSAGLVIALASFAPNLIDVLPYASLATSLISGVGNLALVLVGIFLLFTGRKYTFGDFLALLCLILFGLAEPVVNSISGLTGVLSFLGIGVGLFTLMIQFACLTRLYNPWS